MTVRPKRDASWYAEEAERFWQKAGATGENGALRISYIALAREYEELAATLRKRTAGSAQIGTALAGLGCPASGLARYSPAYENKGETQQRAICSEPHHLDRQSSD